MTATKQDISRWFDTGATNGQSHMIVVYDSFDHENYPVYTITDAQARAKFDEFDGKTMQWVDEVYDLSMDRNEQLNARRVMNLPPSR